MVNNAYLCSSLNKKLYYHLPIICYSMHSHCNVSLMLINMLNKNSNKNDLHLFLNNSMSWKFSYAYYVYLEVLMREFSFHYVKMSVQEGICPYTSRISNVWCTSFFYILDQVNWFLWYFTHADFMAPLYYLSFIYR